MAAKPRYWQTLLFVSIPSLQGLLSQLCLFLLSIPLSSLFHPPYSLHPSRWPLFFTGSCVFFAHQDLFRRVRAILNKLTPQMFQQLMKQVTQLAIDTEERLKGVIDLIFEKAISEPNFSVAYANMCRCLMAVSFHCFPSLVVWPPTP